jgi:hypothetical protein
LLAALAVAAQVRAGGERDVGAAQAGELGDAQSGLDHGQQQRVVASAGPALAVGGGQQRSDLLVGEERDDRLWAAFGRDREHARDCVGVLGVSERGVVEQRADRR